MAKLYIGQLAPEIKEKDLEELFSKQGKIIGIEMKTNYAFVEFEDRRDAEDALKLDGLDFLGCKLKVQMSYKSSGDSRVGDGRDGGRDGGRGGGRRLVPGEGRCFNCNQEGHWVRECPSGPGRYDRFDRDGYGRYGPRHDRFSRRSRSRSRSRSPPRFRPRSPGYYGRPRGRTPSPPRNGRPRSPSPGYRSRGGPGRRSPSPYSRSRSGGRSPYRSRRSPSPRGAPYRDAPPPLPPGGSYSGGGGSGGSSSGSGGRDRDRRDYRGRSPPAPSYRGRDLPHSGPRW